MPRITPAFPLLALLAIGASIASSGCTAIGFGAGALIDSGSGKGPPSRLVGVRSGVGITIWLRDGRTLNGIYRGNRESSGEAAALATPAGADPLAAPSGVVILLETHQGVQEIPAGKIWRVSVPVARGKVIGTLIGLGLDAIVVSAAWAASGSIY